MVSAQDIRSRVQEVTRRYEYVKNANFHLDQAMVNRNEVSQALFTSRDTLGKGITQSKSLLDRYGSQYDDPLEAVIALQVRAQSVADQLNEAQAASRAATGDMLGANAHLQTMQKVQAFYLDYQEKVTRKYITSLESTLNEVFQYVFQKPQKQVILTLDESYGKQVVKVRTVRKSKESGTPLAQEDLDESGFSVSVVLGTIMLLYFIILNNLERVVFLDEALQGLSARSTQRFYAVLRQFVTEHGFKFFIVSHDEKVAPFADTVYFMEDGHVRTI